MSKLDNKNTYVVDVECGNCDYFGEIEIGKGRLVSDIWCPKCDCKKLGKMKREL